MQKTASQIVDEVLFKLAKPYRERAELYAVDSKGRVLGGFYDNNQGFGTFGGGIDPGEDPAEAAAREFREESGYRVKNVRPAGVKPLVWGWSGFKTNEPVSDEWKERAKKYKGSRTHYYIGEIEGKRGPRAATDNSYPFKNVQYRPISDVIQRQKQDLLELDEASAKTRLRRRLEVLQALEKQHSRNRPT